MSERTIHERLADIQARLITPKGRNNAFGGFKFRSCEDILAALKPLLVENNCTLILDDEVTVIGDRFYMKATATLSDGKDSVTTRAWAREPEHKTKSDDAQVTGMASSYARKYALCGLFIVDGTDNKDFDEVNNDNSIIAQLQPEEPEKPAEPVIPADVAAAVKAAPDKATLTRIWNANADLKLVQKFKDMVSQRRHELEDGTAASA